MKFSCRVFRILAPISLVLAITGCAGALAALQAATQGAQLIGSAVAAADEGQKAFFQRHPSLEGQTEIGKALRDAKVAVLALNRAASAAEGVEGKDYAKALADAQAAYRALHSLLKSWGILDGRAPAGGADGDGPPAEPLDLPPPDEIDART